MVGAKMNKDDVARSETIGILLDSGHVGGVATYSLSLAAGLRELNSLDVYVFCPDEPTQALIELAEAWKLRVWRLKKDARLKTRFLRRRLPEVGLWHVNGYRSTIWAALSRKPFVATQHGVPAEVSVLRQSMYNRAHVWAQNRALARIAVDSDSRELLEVRDSSSPIHLILNAPRTGSAHPRVRSDSVSIGYIGRLAYEKGSDRLPAIFGHLQSSLPFATRFLVQGDGALADQIRPDLSALGVEQDEAGIPRWSEIDMAVMPSRSEGMPFAALEALASGAALMYSPVGGLNTLSGPGLLPVRNWDELPDEVAIRRALDEREVEYWLDVMRIRYDEMIRMHAAVYRQVLSGEVRR